MAARERERRGAPAEVTARDREERDTPNSEGGREGDEKLFGPMGGEGKCCVGNRREVRDEAA